MHVVFVTPEVAPYSTSGNLGEVVGSLASALSELDIEVTIITPFYQNIQPERFNLARRIIKVEVPVGQEKVEIGLLDGKFPSANVSVALVDHPESFLRPGVYGENGEDYADNHRRFHLLSAAVPRLCEALDLSPDVVHCHDWQTALTPMLLQQEEGQTPRTMFTVHDPASAGLFPSSTLEELGLGYDLYHPEGIEFHGKVSWLKAGLLQADRVATLGDAYARELMTEEFGFGYQGVFSAIKDKLVGILPGVDYDTWDPAKDHRLEACYSADDLAGKAQCKRALLGRLELQARPDVPLLVMPGPLDEERGAALMLDALPRLPLDKLQVVFWGPASPGIAARLREAQDGTSGAIAHRPLLDQETLHHVLAGADGVLLPARYEPSGLLALKALRYGTVPVGRGVGVFKDTVVDYDLHTGTGTGFHFQQWEPAGLDAAVQRFLEVHRKPEVMQGLMRNAMAQQYPWRQAARLHKKAYEGLLAR